MVIRSVHITNFRCIRDATLYCDALTALVGANGVGKSTFLQALALFYSQKPSLTSEDICHYKNGEDVEITVTYRNLSPPAKTLFAKYIENDELAVTRVLKYSNGRTIDTIHGSRLSYPDFAPIRAATAVKDAKPLYTALNRRPEFSDLPAWQTREATMAALDSWEARYPELCTRQRDDGQFFGYQSVGGGYLARYSRFVLVPAVRDAAQDAADGKSSLFAELIDLVVRNGLAGDTRIEELNTEITARYKALLESGNATELERVQGELTQTLQTYIPDAEIKLLWGNVGDVTLPAPRALAKVGEHGYDSSIDRKGHGLQRAFIMTLLQYLHTVRSSRHADEGLTEIPDLILAIEEPELYQHPDRQRHIASVLRGLASVTEGATPSTQVMYTTHSPHFVGLDRFDSIRLARKVTDGIGPVPTTVIVSVSLEEVASQLAGFVGGDSARFTASSLRIRLQTIMTPWMNEGFFADVVVLVEGEQDRAALLGLAQRDGHDLESIGFAVIPCMGKRSLDRPLLIFRSLGIPVFALWDSDKDKNDSATTNRTLLRIVGEAEDDYPEFVRDTSACFREKIEVTLAGELGATIMSEIVSALQDEFEIRRDDCLKNPTLMKELLLRAKSRGATSPTLEAILQNVLALGGRAERKVSASTVA